MASTARRAYLNFQAIWERHGLIFSVACGLIFGFSFRDVLARIVGLKGDQDRVVLFLALVAAPAAVWRLWLAERNRKVLEENRTREAHAHAAEMYHKATEALADVREREVEDEDRIVRRMEEDVVERHLSGIRNLRDIAEYMPETRMAALHILAAYIERKGRRLAPAPYHPDRGPGLDSLLANVEEAPTSVQHAIDAFFDLKRQHQRQDANARFPKLRYANFRKMDVSAFDFSRLEVEGAFFEKTTFRDTILADAVFWRAHFEGAVFEDGCRFDSRTSLIECGFRRSQWKLAVPEAERPVFFGVLPDDAPGMSQSVLVMPGR